MIDFVFALLFSLIDVIVHNILVLKVYASQIHAILEETLQAVGAKAMVVGHTPQTVGVNWYGNTLHHGYITTKLF